MNGVSLWKRKIPYKRRSQFRRLGVVRDRPDYKSGQNSDEVQFGGRKYSSNYNVYPFVPPTYCVGGVVQAIWQSILHSNFVYEVLGLYLTKIRRAPKEHQNFDFGSNT
jgi:hypothetical protein